MIKVDKSDQLFKYLTDIGAEDVEKEYIKLGKLGRYKLQDIRQYYADSFRPSNTNDLSEKELEKVVDYYADLKKVKYLKPAEIKTKLKLYKESKDERAKLDVINTNLKDVFMMCMNYKTMHDKVDIQDLVQIANIGLLTAIEKYKVGTSLEFKDYVIYWTRDIITKELEENNG